MAAIKSSKLSYKSAERLLSKPKIKLFYRENEQAVAVHVEVLKIVFKQWAHISKPENYNQQLQKDFLKFGEKDDFPMGKKLEGLFTQVCGVKGI